MYQVFVISDLESNKDISKSPTASILRNSNTYQSSINQHYRNSLPYHTSIQHQNAPSASFLDRLIKPGRKLSSATSLSHLPLADDSSAKQHKSFSFSRTFGRSKKRKAHKWHLVDSNDVGSAFEFAFDATGGPRSGQGSGPMGSSDLVPCCTTCNRPLEEPNDGQLSISSIAICIRKLRKTTTKRKSLAGAVMKVSAIDNSYFSFRAFRLTRLLAIRQIYFDETISWREWWFLILKFDQP